MAKQLIDITHEFNVPVEQLFNFLAEHENLTKIFALTSIKRIKNGEDQRNGVGSARAMRILGGPVFVETVTACVPNERIEYTITKGSPLKNHYGIMRFSSSAKGGSKLHYTIEFEGRLPLIGPIVKVALENGIKKGFKGLRL